MNVKLSKDQKKVAVANPKDIAVIMQQILKRENKMGRAQEHFWVIGLNNANKILFIELIALGRQNRVDTKPPDVFRMAIYKLALRLIMVHNHPSGELVPSRGDINFTDRILKVGEIINIEVLDHLIVTEKGYVSFADEGIMDDLRSSDTWRVTDGKDEEQIRKMKEDIEKLENNTRMIAKSLREDGMDISKISQMTGLKISEIKKL
jgi:DNA repair protein RadC